MEFEQPALGDVLVRSSTSYGAYLLEVDEHSLVCASRANIISSCDYCNLIGSVDNSPTAKCPLGARDAVCTCSHDSSIRKY